MLVVGGQNTSLNSLIVTNPDPSAAAPLGDVDITLPLTSTQFLAYTSFLNDGSNTGVEAWRNTNLSITGTDGVQVDLTNGFNWALSADDTVIRTFPPGGSAGNEQVINGNLAITGDVNISGKLTVPTIEYTNIGVTSPGTSIIILNANQTTPTQNGSLYVYRGPVDASTGLVWDETLDGWYFQYRTGVDIADPGFPVSGGGTLTGNFLIWNSGNDGIGSGLDADLLDGQQGTYYTNATNMSAGMLPAARLPAFSGDVTSVAGTAVLNLLNTGVVAGTYGSATSVPVITVDAKGRITTAISTAIPTATTAVAGIMATATQAETAAGVVTTKAVTPNSLTGALNNLQPKNANLDSISLQTLAPDTLMYGTGPGTVALTSLPAYGRSLIASIDATAARGVLGIPANAVALTYTPVQQGGGAGQGTNKVYIGWSASGLLLQVDTTDFANNWPISISKNAATATKLATARTINGVAFDGTTDIIVPAAPDSGWVSIPLINGFTNFPGNGTTIPANPMQCRKIGNRVTVRGGARRAAGPPGIGVDIGTLPVGYRPTNTVNYNAMWITANTFEAQLWNCFIYPDGRLNSGFDYNINPASPANGDGNVGFSFSFLTD